MLPISIFSKGPWVSHGFSSLLPAVLTGQDREKVQGDELKVQLERLHDWKLEPLKEKDKCLWNKL